MIRSHKRSAGDHAWLWVPRQESHRLRITGGVEGLNRHSIVSYFRRHANDVNLAIEVLPSEGTMEATNRLEKRELDMALVNGLIRSPQCESIARASTSSSQRSIG